VPARWGPIERTNGLSNWITESEELLSIDGSDFSFIENITKMPVFF
jgi:hypothetical protein